MASCIPLTKMVQQMNLKNVTPEIDISQIKVHVPDINRPAHLQYLLDLRLEDQKRQTPGQW